MTNLRKAAGDNAEREAVRILSDLLGAGWHRPKRAGERDDVGDAWHQVDTLTRPDTIAQVSTVREWKESGRRADIKAFECAKQQARAEAAHGVTLLRIKGPAGVVWRAVLNDEQADKLDIDWMIMNPSELMARWTDSMIVTLAPDIEPCWRTRSGLIVTSVHEWACAWREATA